MGDFETDHEQWRLGEQRLNALEGATAARAHDVVVAVLSELRRRLGGPYDVDELCDLYEQGTDWCVEVAMRAAPDAPELWDARLIADATFARYVRGARDYAGGRRVH